MDSFDSNWARMAARIVYVDLYARPNNRIVVEGYFSNR